MYTLFISDLHLEQSQAALTQLFLTLLRKCTDTIDALYILGDLFAYWVGDDDNTATAMAVRDGLQQLTRHGIPVFILQGNRDFLLGHDFMRDTGCQLLHDPSVITVYNTPVALSHGDQFTTDRDYLRYRRLVHHAVVQRYFLRLPLTWRHRMAHYLRRKSQMTPRNQYVNDADWHALQPLLQQHHTLIHGHTHLPCVHYTHAPTGDWIRRFVLCDWEHPYGNALLWRKDTTPRLVYFTAQQLTENSWHELGGFIHAT